jgi:cell division protein FtsB
MCVIRIFGLRFWTKKDIKDLSCYLNENVDIDDSNNRYILNRMADLEQEVKLLKSKKKVKK